MQVTLPEDLEGVVDAAVRSGRYPTADALVDEALREKLRIDRLVDAHYVRLAQEALAEDGPVEPGPNWREGILALAAERRGR